MFLINVLFSNGAITFLIGSYTFDYEFGGGGIGVGLSLATAILFTYGSVCFLAGTLTIIKFFFKNRPPRVTLLLS